MRIFSVISVFDALCKRDKPTVLTIEEARERERTMAERPKGYGMTAELEEKKAAKYDPELEAEARDWMERVTGDRLPGGSLHAALKDGVYLCKLINKLQPGSVPKVNSSKMAFKMMENIGNFLSACEKYGLKKTDLFQTVDLYEDQHMVQVVLALHALGRKAKTKGKPGIGPKEATANKRSFDEGTKRAGQSVIGLQMGTNRGASQAGMTPTGLGRQVYGVNLKGVQ